MADLQVSQALDYKPKQKSHGRYQYHKITTTGGTTVTLQMANNVETFMYMPNPTFPNFGRSVLDYTFTPGTPTGNANGNFVYMNCLSHIHEIELVTNQNQKLVSIPYLPYYTNLVWCVETPLEDFVTFDGQWPHHDATATSTTGANVIRNLPVSTTVAALNAGAGVIRQVLQDNFPTFGNKTTRLFQKNNAISKYPMIRDMSSNANGNVTVIFNTSYLNSLRLIQTGLAGDQEFCDQAGTEPMYFVCGEKANDDAVISTNGPILHVQIPLYMLYNTVLGMDKNLYFNEDVRLRIVWNADSKTRFMGNNILDPLSGAAIPNGTATSITNLYLYLAVEQDPMIRQTLKSACEAGLSFPIPWVHYAGQNFANAGATDNVVTIKYGNVHGQRLKRIYHSIYHADGNPIRLYDHHNLELATNPGSVLNQTKTPSYRVYIDGEPRQQFDINCVNGEDYLLNRPLLEGSVLQNQNIYKWNWVHIEDFTDQDSGLCRRRGDCNDLSIDGLDIGSRERTYMFKVNGALGGAGISLNHLVFAITTKTLKYVNSQILVV